MTALEQNTRKRNRRVYASFLAGSLLCTLIAAVLFMLGYRSETGPFVIGIFVFLALFVRGSEFWSVTAFTLWVTAFVATAMYFPKFFTNVNGVETKPYIMNIIQFIMFGMGTTLSIKDFKRVFLIPQAIVIGIVLQFTVMPFVGKTIAFLFAPNPEVAAGIVLNGSCPGGVASNVINFLARTNVALSVTLTAVSTLVAPIMTPAMTKWLAGAYIEINFMDMMISILNMVIIPVLGGLIFNNLLKRMATINRNFPEFPTVSCGRSLSVPCWASAPPTAFLPPTPVIPSSSEPSCSAFSYPSSSITSSGIYSASGARGSADSESSIPARWRSRSASRTAPWPPVSPSTSCTAISPLSPAWCSPPGRTCPAPSLPHGGRAVR